MMRLSFGTVLGVMVAAATAGATEIYPIDRAAVLAGSRFDFKVEFDGVVDPAAAKVTVNGADYASLLGKADFVAKEKDVEASALILRNAVIDKPGTYKVEASDGKVTRTVTWEVYAADAPRAAKNVILLVGDGLSVGHRTAARILSKGIREGKYNGRLAMDDMPHMAMVGTSGADSVITDSANSASAYNTGHKSSVNGLGVYADRTKDSFDDPKQETLAEFVKRRMKMAVGVVSDAELQDATPAAVVSHTRRRADKAEITGMFFDARPEVLLGGGSAYFLAKSTPGSKRKDETNYLEKFQGAGYKLATTDAEMQAAAKDPATRQLLGLFHPGNMDGVLDRKFLKPSYVQKFPNQPDLVDMTKAAIEVLSRNPDGFYLQVEAALIDKASHPLDWERAVYDTIMLDKAVEVAKDFARKNGDTLVIVLGDHTHGVSIIGTVDDNAKGESMRDKVGIYAEAGYPNYEDKDRDGYPDRVDVSKRLAIFFNNHPDYYETFRPKLEGVFVPAVQNEKKQYVANEAYKNVPGAVFMAGNLPYDADTGVHTADDMVVTAIGPGSEAFHGFLDNTEVFRAMAKALGLGAAEKSAAAK